MTVLVTGGAGFIGANLTHRLLSLGEHVRVLDNLSRPGVERNVGWLLENHANKFELVVGDVRDAPLVEQVVEGVHHVFHLAAQVAVTTSLVDPHHDFAVNGLGALNLLEAVRRSRIGPTLIYTSTSKVYGALDDVTLSTARTRYEVVDPEIARCGISEKRPLELHGPFGCSKGAADQYVLDYARSFSVRAAVFRMSTIYGPRQFGTEDQGWVAHFLNRALQDEPITIHGDGRQVRDLLFIDDLVDAFLRARENIDRIAGSAFNVGGGPTRTISLLELCKRIEDAHSEAAAPGLPRLARRGPALLRVGPARAPRGNRLVRTHVRPRRRGVVVRVAVATTRAPRLRAVRRAGDGVTPVVQPCA